MIARYIILNDKIEHVLFAFARNFVHGKKFHLSSQKELTKKASVHILIVCKVSDNRIDDINILDMSAKEEKKEVRECSLHN